MSWMKGDLLKKIQKLFGGLATREPAWLKAMKAIASYDPDPARVFGWRVLELKKQGASEEQAMAVVDMEYRAEKKAKKKAYKRLKELALMQGKKPPPNPYPSAIKEIQAEERKYVRDRFYNPNIRKLLQQMREQREIMLQDRVGGDGAGDQANWINE